MVRESDLVMMTQRGPRDRRRVARRRSRRSSLSLLLVTLMLGRASRHRRAKRETRARRAALPRRRRAVEQVLEMNDMLQLLAEGFAEKQHALFLGRGPMWPIAMEGALKLKEISYIHAEAYAAGELKHGPLALIDEEMPVIVVAPNNDAARQAQVEHAGSARARRRALRVRGSRDAGSRPSPA